jgi:hypothetical protein
MFDSAHEHVGSCSPCFKELTEIRRALQKRKVLLWAMGTTGTAIVIFAVWITYFGFRRTDNSVRPQMVQTETTRESSGAVLALLDLRNASATRTVEPAGANSSVPPIEIGRGLLALTVELPVGSEAGLYELEIRNSNQQPIQAAKAPATVEGGITKLLINVDTRSIPPDQYEFAWRLADFGWRHHPILIR